MDFGQLATGAARGVAGYMGAGQSQPGQQRRPGYGGMLMEYLAKRKKRMNPGVGIPGSQATQTPGYNPVSQEPDPYYPNAFAQGGIVTEPTTALIGENGPEMVVPLGYRPDAKVGPRNALRMNYSR
jgi:hypothetical protein